jgi:hypothetical protein
MVEEIQIYITNPNHDFEEGLRLFQKYSRNRSVFLYLQRKHDVKKLIYELEKLAKLPGLKVKIPDAKKQVPETPKPAKLEKEISDDGDPEADHKIIEPRRVKREDLSPELQIVFDQIAENYKIQRSFHEKMKLAETDQERAEFRKELVRLDDEIAAGWQSIDQPEMTAKTEASAVDVNKQINAARTTISRMIKNYKPENKQKMLDYINTLILHNASVKLPTRQKLIDLHVIDEKSNLLGR